MHCMVAFVFGDYLQGDKEMFQPPESYKECPHCGYDKAILILDYYGLLPQLDSFGYPQYHCPRCANTFSAGDTSPDGKGQSKGNDNKDKS